MSIAHNPSDQMIGLREPPRKNQQVTSKVELQTKKCNKAGENSGK